MRSGERPPSTLALADGWVDLDTRTVVRGSVRQRLSRSEAELLRWLAERPRRDVPRNVLHREVLGVSPRVVTRAVDHLVARLRRKIEINPAEPRHLLTAHGVGYRFVPAEPGRAEQGSLPRAAPPLVGRAAELEHIEQRFDAGAGLVTLVGGAGVGKTRLAVEYAHRWADAGKRVTFVDLCVCGATTDFVPALALALGASPEDVDRALSADASHLIVLDNAEHLLPDFAGELSLLLARPESTALDRHIAGSPAHRRRGMRRGGRARDRRRIDAVPGTRPGPGSRGRPRLGQVAAGLRAAGRPPPGAGAGGRPSAGVRTGWPRVASGGSPRRAARSFARRSRASLQHRAGAALVVGAARPRRAARAGFSLAVPLQFRAGGRPRRGRRPARGGSARASGAALPRRGRRRGRRSRVPCSVGRARAGGPGGATGRPGTSTTALRRARRVGSPHRVRRGRPTSIRADRSRAGRVGAFGRSCHPGRRTLRLRARNERARRPALRRFNGFRPRHRAPDAAGARRRGVARRQRRTGRALRCPGPAPGADPAATRTRASGAGAGRAAPPSRHRQGGSRTSARARRE